MTDKLPPNLLALFAPRPPLRYLQPPDHAPEERITPNITGVGAYLQAFKEHEDDYVPTESWLQKRDRKKLERKQAAEERLTEGAKTYKPAEDPQVRGDAFKTLFVSRLSYDIESKDLEREFGRFGPIERIRVVSDITADEHAVKKKKKNRGYAFIVYEREKDMKAAYKETDGIRIKDRRVLVDVERGRTVSGWKPRRFGGGLGGRGYTKAAPARPLGGPPSGPGGFGGGGGGRGGFRGGFGGGGGRGGGGGFRGGRGGGGFGGGRGGGFGGGRGGGFGEGRGGIGYQGPNGHAPDDAPSGPRGGRGGFGRERGGYGGGGRYGDRDRDPNGYGGGVRYDDRDGRPSGSGSNLEPVRPRERGGYRDRDREPSGHGYGGHNDRDRDRDRDGYGSSRKREHDDHHHHQDPRKLRRY